MSSVPDARKPASRSREGGPVSGGTLRDRLLALRDRLLGSPRFQRWAAGFPLTRPIARKRARALFDICAGFVYSQVLLACVRLKLFELLRAEGPRTAAELAPRLAMAPDAASRLLEAAAALDLLSRRGKNATGQTRYGLGGHGAAMLGNPGIAAMVEHHPLLYDDLRDPVALLRGEMGETALGRYWAYARSDSPDALEGGQVGAYSGLMAASQGFIAAEVLDAYPLRRHRRLLDVGGGEGAFLMAAARRAPDLELTLFDLPAVARRAEARFAEAGLENRLTAVGGDFFADPLPAGADVVSLVRILHDHDDDSVLRLLRNVVRALPREGTLLIAEPMSGTRDAANVTDAYFGIYLFAMGQGRPRSPERLGELLREAGFADVRRVPTRSPLLTSLLTARPASLTQEA